MVLLFFIQNTKGTEEVFNVVTVVTAQEFQTDLESFPFPASHSIDLLLCKELINPVILLKHLLHSWSKGSVNNNQLPDQQKIKIRIKKDIFNPTYHLIQIEDFEDLIYFSGDVIKYEDRYSKLLLKNPNRRFEKMKNDTIGSTVDNFGPNVINVDSCSQFSQFLQLQIRYRSSDE